MITLKLFKKIIKDIQDQELRDEKLTELLVCPDCTGWINSAEAIMDDLIKLVAYELGDKYEYIEWYLYDISDGNKFVYHKGIKYDLNSLDDLYYFIIEEYDKVKQEPCNEEELYETSEMTFDETVDLVKQIWEE